MENEDSLNERAPNAKACGVEEDVSVLQSRGSLHLQDTAQIDEQNEDSQDEQAETAKAHGVKGYVSGNQSLLRPPQVEEVTPTCQQNLKRHNERFTIAKAMNKEREKLTTTPRTDSRHASCDVLFLRLH